MAFDVQYLAENWFNIAVTAFTAVSGIIAYLTFKDSRRGSEIELLTLGPFYSVAYVRDLESPPRQNMFFRIPLVFQNKGPRGGAIVGLRGSVKFPLWTDVESSVELVSPKYQHFDESSSSLALRENDTASMTMIVNFTMGSSAQANGKPVKTFQEMVKIKGSVTLTLSYRVPSSKRGKLEGKSNDLEVYLMFKK
jgi:hypothetical protein